MEVGDIAMQGMCLSVTYLFSDFLLPVKHKNVKFPVPISPG